MQLTHRFTLPAPVEQAWTAFYFPNRIAPCFPGATLDRVAGNDIEGVLKIKLGPVPVQYEGTATFLERSAEEQRIALEAHGKDRRGHGMIAATVTMTFTEVGSQTDVEVITTVELTGQGAAFGETVVQEASDRLVQRLVDCVSGKFADGLGDLPSAEELATARPAEQAVPPKEATGEATSDTVEPLEAVGPDRVPVADVAAEPADTDAADVAAEPADTDTAHVAAEPADTDTAHVAAEPADTDTAHVAAEPADTDTAHVAPEPADIDAPAPADIDTAERADMDAAEASPPDSDDATAARELSRASPPPQSATLSTTTGPQRGALATVVLPRVRRFGPPVLGGLVVGSLISGIVRRLRR
jgi:uncharacterized protein